MDTRLIFETEYWNIFLSEDQTYFGRCVVDLKRKCGSLAELTEEEMINFLNIVKRYELTFKKHYGATMFNWTCLMNDAYKRNPPDPQVHWHCRPRYKTPLMFEGFEFKDPNFGHHYDREAKRELDNNTKEKLITELKSRFVLPLKPI